MIRRVCLCSLFTLMCFGMEVDEIISKHIEARGGTEAWQAVKTLKVKGSYHAFSVVSPFELIREQEGSRYFFDSTQNGKKVVIGYDGTELWWLNRWFGKSATPISGLDKQVLMREVNDFPSPFFGYKEKGYEVKFLGEQDFDGLSTIGLKLKRDDESEETWYLDPDTYLEVGYDAKGSDFGMPQPSRTFFDEFQKIENVMIPFVIETQFYTRSRILMVDEVTLNDSVDREIYQRPLPMGIEEIKHMVGKFNVNSEKRQSPRGPFNKVSYQSEITKRVDGGMLEEFFTDADGNETIRTFSFDTGLEVYRVTRVGSSSHHMLVMQGTRNEEQKIVVDSLAGHSSFKTDDYEANFRLTLSEFTADGFKLINEASVDGGENWFELEKATYTRVSE